MARRAPTHKKRLTLDAVEIGNTSERSAAASNPTSLLLPPPGLPLPALNLPRRNPSDGGCGDNRSIVCSNKLDDIVSDDEEFSDLLRSRRLPPTLDHDEHRYQRLQSAVLSCIESLYRDRITPQLGEVHRRLRQNSGSNGGGWLSSELHAVLAICARQPSTYRLVPCHNGEQPLVLLRSSPKWFRGWINIDDDGPGTYPPRVWNDLRHLLQGAAGARLATGGGVRQVATTLHRQGMLLPPSLQCLTLGELEHIVKLALGCDQDLLIYDHDNGSRLKTCSTPVEEECVCNVAASVPQFSLETQLEDFLPYQSEKAWQQSWMNPRVTFHWI